MINRQGGSHNPIEEMLKSVEAIDKKFFAKHKGFMREFGLLIFPFFTFYDALLERMELDIRQFYDRRYFWQKWFYRTKVSTMENILESFYHSIQEQWEAVQRDAAEAFVERYGQFVVALDELDAQLPRMLQEDLERYRVELARTVAQFFSIERHNWQDSALDEMGLVLGQHAKLVLPKQEQLFVQMNALKGVHYLQDLELYLQEERIRFHQALHQVLMQVYKPVCERMQAGFEQFKQEIETVLESK
jgi:hypothetical protein